ncbi:undecaprenyl/decaprenyl-phosphate alpha-N-acetylglucosaminyl 1-phosphate transferase [Gammaproteobacteria bacterium]|nr:undecaprenyl/decaprenyl-phosphate alpha-N-acetylglucosaminyl 1-phosphate transferase [Gammaproteobacteria bacterium]
MLFSIAVTLLFLSFFASVVFTGFLRDVAKKKNFLIDIPNKSRKFHFRPTPLVGGIAIHASMLLSTLLMLFLVDYKYDFKIEGFDWLPSSISKISEKGYSQKLSIVNDEGEGEESYRINLTSQDAELDEALSFNASIGSAKDAQLIITPLSNKTFQVLMPDGVSKSFELTEDGVTEVGLSGEPLSLPINVQNSSASLYPLSSFTVALFLVAILLQIFTLVDDAYGVRPAKRLLGQSIGALAVIILGNIYITSLQISILGISLQLGFWGIPFTVVAVVGIINAFNMIDGINGLCAGLALVAIGALQVASGFNVSNYSLVIAMGSIIGFLFYNLGFLGTKRRVFLGDNGSTFLGFLVAWTCINYSQGEANLIMPVTCLWIVAIPLLDCIGVMVYRVMRGILPFDAGRDHIHHKLQTYLGSSFKALTFLCGMGVSLASIGIIIEKTTQSSEISLLIFLGVAACYYFGSNYISTKILTNNTTADV